MQTETLRNILFENINSPNFTLLAEICAVSRISKKEIGRCFKLILKALETSVDLITTGDFMSRFCSNLGLPKQVQMAATFIARKAVELDLVPGRSPISVAAAAIYMASQASAEKKTQKGKKNYMTTNHTNGKMHHKSQCSVSVLLTKCMYS